MESKKIFSYVRMPTSPEKARASSSKYYEKNKEKILEKMKEKRQVKRENDPGARPVGRPKIISELKVQDV
jgi:hypothetical protein